MEENNRKYEILKAMTNVEYYPAVFAEKVSIKKYTKLPLAKISAWGTAFEPLIAAFQNVVHGGATKSGLYKVTIPKSGHLAKFRDGSGYLGAVLKENNAVGGGQARLNPLVCNPTMLSMAVLFMAVEKKLDAIHETQKEILAFLELKEEAKLKGNLNALADVLNNYKHNWNNDKYKDHKHILVQDIKREAEQSIILYREQLTKALSKKALFQDFKATLNKTIARLTDYQLALYTFSFSSFLGVMLLENFDTNYLNSIVSKIKEYSDDYTLLYEKCAEKIEKDSKASLKGYALKGLSKISSGAGKIVEKIPIISKSQLDENLIRAGSLLQDVDTNRTQNVMQMLADSQTDYISSFVENIQTIDNLYNQSMQLMFDSENIYIAKVATAID